MKIILCALNAKYTHSNLAVQYLKAYCSDYDIHIAEYNINQPLDSLVRELYKMKPDLLCFSVYIWNLREVIYLSRTLKTVAPNLPILWGGPEVSYTSEQLLAQHPYVDYIISGEGEETTKQLLDSLSGRGPTLSDIKGLSYRDGANIRVNEERPLLSDPDAIPSPFQDMTFSPDRILYYESSRGCPYGCRFCLSSTSRGLRFFSRERVEADLRCILQSGVRQVKFVDRTFNAGEAYAIDLMQFLVDHAPEGMNFHFELMAHVVSEEFLTFLQTVPKGLFQFEIGIQSTNPETLKAVGRTTDFARLSEVVRTIHSYGNIHLHLDLIAGLPYENYASFRNSFNDIYALDSQKLQLGFLKVLKGSGLWTDDEKYGLVYNSEPPYEILTTPWLSYDEMNRLKMLEDVVEKFHNEDYFYHTNAFLIEENFDTPFDYYETLARYWEAKSFHMRAHQRKSLYRILFDFAQSILSDASLSSLKQMLAYDFLLHQNEEPPAYLEMVGAAPRDLHALLHNEAIRSHLAIPEEIPTKKLVRRMKLYHFSEPVRHAGIMTGEQTLLFSYLHCETEVLDVTRLADQLLVLEE